LKLRPFSPHHAQALLEIESPYICEEGAESDCSKWDTTAALAIIRSRRKDGMTPVARLDGGILCRLRWRLWWLFRRHRKVALQLSEYVAAGCRFPEMFTPADSEGGGAASTGADWPFYLVSVIAQEVPSIPYRDLWDMPVSELAGHKAIISERSGGATIAEKALRKLARIRQEKEESEARNG
jgi:hypothetical protein